MKRSRAYREYLLSDAWKQKRRALANCFDALCHCCGKPPEFGKPLDLHHLTYERLGNELPEDLVPVCRSCHTLIHDLLPKCSSIVEATERVRVSMRRKSSNRSRPCRDILVTPPLLVPGPGREPPLNPKAIHPGSRGNRWKSPEYIARRKSQRAENKRKHLLAVGMANPPRARYGEIRLITNDGRSA